MHGTLVTEPLTMGSIRSQVNVFGEPEAEEQEPRVAVQMTLHLSFAEILGRLLFTPGALLMREDLESGSEAKIVECLWFAMAQTGLDAAEDFAHLALDVYEGRRRGELHDFAVRLGAAVTRIFGVSAPEPPASAAVFVPALSLVRGVKAVAV
ncbi:hypothetical protein [Kitasatospora phosalacinea]|uniref:Uncharacterized protein n=1 Tax=Kitasatospora phosalacinea TaxID=2065 RepID=A0A9W6PFC6_9ACTN|nr:hypothetical protein [Kitasatospora phosalacinea]GLW53867.1 hypothetical protein Kpho01_18780 [Kitasatospora phosalacinea]